MLGAAPRAPAVAVNNNLTLSTCSEPGNSTYA